MGFGNKKKELRKAIKKAESEKKRKQNFVGDLMGRYEAGEITKKEYERLLNKFLEGENLGKWNRYYDESVEVYQRHLDYRSINLRLIVPILVLLAIGVFYLFIFSGVDLGVERGVREDLDGRIFLAPDEEFFFDDCSNLDSWDVGLGEWRTRNILQDSRCTSQNYVGACGTYCTYNMVNSPLFDLSNAVEADISFDWFLRNLDENENFSFYLSDGTNEVEVGTVFGVRDQQWQNGQITLQIENHISLTDSVSVRFQCDGVNGTYANEYCGVDNINVTIDSAQGDVDPPVVVVDAPTARTYNNNEVRPLLIQATVTDADPNLIVEYSFDDGQTNFSMTDIGGNVYSAEHSGLVSGGYTVNVYAQDSSGNMNNNEFVDFSIDNTLISGCGAVIDDVSEGFSYSLTQDITSGFADCINVSLDGISLDGQGFGIVGSSEERGINVLQDDVDTFNLMNINISLFAESVGDSNLTIGEDGIKIIISNSEVGQVVSPGGNNNAVQAGHGGSVLLIDSNVTDKVDVSGGDFDHFEEGGAGIGGNITFESEFVNLTGVNLNVGGGIEQLGGPVEAGVITINSTAGFEDSSPGVYGSRFNIHLINGSLEGGEIRWLSEISQVINFKDIGGHSQIGHNYSFVDPVVDGGKGINLGPLNSPAEIIFYDMTDGFSDPKIWKDDVECTDCYNFTSLNTIGDIRFNVTGFSSYRIGDEILIVDEPPQIVSISDIVDQTINVGEKDLMLWYGFDNDPGNGVWDYSGREHDGICSAEGCPYYNISGSHDDSGALEFYGDDNGQKEVGITGHSDFNIARELTLAAWVKPRAFDIDQRIVHKRFGSTSSVYALELDNGILEFKGKNCTGNAVDAGSQPVNLNDWSHVAITYVNGTGKDTVKFYIDGQPVETVSDYNIEICGDPAPVEIGGFYARSVRWFNGTIDDVRIYDRALSDTEIQNIYDDVNVKAVKDVVFDVTVSDANGYTDIVKVNASLIPGTDLLTRDDDFCVFSHNTDPNTAVFNCEAGILYYDEPGSWSVEAFARDSLDNEDSLLKPGEFLLGETAQVGFEGINWLRNSLFPGGSDVLADDSQEMLNTGNKEIVLIEVIGADLVGDDLTPITPDRFSVDSSEVCIETPRLDYSTPVPFSVSLPRGSPSIGNSYELYYCAEEVPLGLPAQSYSGQWDLLFSFILGILTIFTLPISLRKRLVDMLKELSREELLEVLGERMLEIRESENNVPISIFKEDIGPAEVLCKYLKENEGMRFSEIADLIKRDQRTVWNNYHHAVKKSKGKIRPGKGIGIPIDVFGNRKLSVLESVVYYLKEKGYRNLEIAKMLGRDSRNIWTLYSRAKKKIKA